MKICRLDEEDAGDVLGRWAWLLLLLATIFFGAVWLSGCGK